MREFYLTLDSCFRNGLRPVKGMASNPQFMSYLLNGRPTVTGLEPYIPLSSYYSSTAFDWPYPQIFRGLKYTLFGTRTTINEENVDGWAVIATDNEDDPWEFIDYTDFMIVSRGGNKLWIRNPVLNGTAAWNSYNGGLEYPVFKTGCDYKGQLVVGNLRHYKGTGSYLGSCPNAIAASRVGTLNFDVRDTARNQYRNSPMFRFIHWNGVVLKVRRLEDLVIVYGDEGAAMLYPKDVYFGYKELPFRGISGPRSVGCSRTRHVVLGVDQKLYEINGQGQIKCLDFYDAMSTLTGDIIVTYSEDTDEFFIGDGVRSFVLYGEKLYECYQLTTSVNLYGSSTLAAKYDTNHPEFLGVTDSFDFGLRGYKTITTVELGLGGAGDYSVALDWRMNSKDAYVRTPFVAVNSEGIVTIPTTALQFRLCVRCADYRDVDISYATIRYKMGDMRSIRGVYAPPPRGQE
jgi:hypothetical protein